mgnify:CR=1 FL=1
MLEQIISLSQQFIQFFNEVYVTLTTRIDELPAISTVSKVVADFFVNLLHGLGVEPTLLAVILFSGGAVVITITIVGWILKAVPVL